MSLLFFSNDDIIDDIKSLLSFTYFFVNIFLNFKCFLVALYGSLLLFWYTSNNLHFHLVNVRAVSREFGEKPHETNGKKNHLKFIYI